MGLDWNGLGWADWVGLGVATLASVALEWAGQTGLCWVALGRAVEGCAGRCDANLGSGELGWVELTWAAGRMC